MRTLHPIALAIALTTTLTAACGKGDSPTAPSPVTTTPPATATPAPVPTTPAAAYAGVYAGARGVNGTFEVSAAAGATSASGFVTIGGSGGTRVELAGTYDAATSTFAVSGGGFSFTARGEGAAASGTCRAPNGAECGVTATRVTSGTSGPERFCGPFNGAPQGRITFLISGGTATGFVSETEGHVNFSAPVSGSSIDITASVGDGHTGRATGTRSGNTWSGTWSNTYGERGTWSASPDGCR